MFHYHLVFGWYNLIFDDIFLKLFPSIKMFKSTSDSHMTERVWLVPRWMYLKGISVEEQAPKRACIKHIGQKRHRWEEIIWLVVSNIFNFHPYLGKISNLTNIFQMGWNHQLVMLIIHVGGCPNPEVWNNPWKTMVGRRSSSFGAR